MLIPSNKKRENCFIGIFTPALSCMLSLHLQSVSLQALRSKGRAAEWSRADQRLSSMHLIIQNLHCNQDLVTFLKSNCLHALSDLRIHAISIALMITKLKNKRERILLHDKGERKKKRQRNRKKYGTLL